jgi:hypothetical protein
LKDKRRKRERTKKILERKGGEEVDEEWEGERK